jgi:Peptidase A4 family
VLRVTAALLALGTLALASSGTADASSTRRFTPRLGADPLVSSNWAGYAVSGTNASGVPTSFTDVTGSWIQPKVSCTAGRPSYSAFWVGLGGFSSESQALEQIGTEANCDTGGHAVYAAWYELVPAPSTPIRMTVRPGDRITAAVLVQGAQVTLQLTNPTRHARVTQRVTAPELDLTSAEWIAEAPSTCTTSGRCRTLPLANFGSVSFTRAAATGDAHAGTITDPAWVGTPILLAESAGGAFGPFTTDQPSSSRSGATPGALSADGRSFAVAWRPAS